LFLFKTDDGGETAEGWTLVQTTSAPIRFGFVPSDYLQPVAASSTTISVPTTSSPQTTSALSSSTTSSVNKSGLGLVVGTSPSLESSSFMQRLNGGITGSNTFSSSGAGSQPISSLLSSPIVNSSNNYSLTGSASTSFANNVGSGVGSYSSGGVGLMQYSASPPNSSTSYSQALVLSESALQSATASRSNTSVAEEFSQLFSSHEEWFRAATAKRQDVYKQLMSEASDIARSLQESEARSTAVVSRINELDSLIADEKRRWTEKLAEVR
jgi:hypothetical protein